jgi:hypothetical protein
MTAGWLRAQRTPLLVIAAYALLLAAWTFGNAPFSVPDEDAHYLRALTLAQGHLVGPRVGYPTPPGASSQRLEQIAWQSQAARLVEVPPGMSPDGFDCNATLPTVSAACIYRNQVAATPKSESDPVGTYPPLAYVLPGLAIHAADDPVSGLLAGRAVAALLCWLLLAVAVALLWSPAQGLVSLTGLLVAFTPTAVFFTGSINPSGLEVVSSVAFIAALVRLGRTTSGHEAPGWVWAAAAVTGCVLALCRQLGPLWIAVDVALVVALVGPRLAWTLARASPRRAAVVTGAVVAALASNRLWEALYGPHVTFSLSPFPHSIRAAAAPWKELVREQIGVFGWLDTRLSWPGYQVFLLLAAVLVLAALVIGTLRQRSVIAAAFGIAVAGPLLLEAAVLRHTGFPMQGRQVLPLTQVALMLAAEVLLLRRERLRRSVRTWLPVAVVVVVAYLQVSAWLSNAHRHAVGSGGPEWFVGHAAWQPPLGWWPWLLLALGGGACLLASTLDELPGGTRGYEPVAGTGSSQSSTSGTRPQLRTTGVDASRTTTGRAALAE